jgi:tetratricopeptide (TPR) repeat protein
MKNTRQKYPKHIHRMVICLCLQSCIAVNSAELSSANQFSEQLLKSAEEHIENLAYRKAARILMRAVDINPEYQHNNRVLSKLGDCFYEMQLYYGADETYRTLLRRYRNNPGDPDAILALQKCRYHLGDDQQSLKFYNALEANYNSFSGMSESRYYAGLIYHNSGKFNLAYNILQLVDEKSGLYHFARYTSALIHLKNKKVRNAIEALLEVVEMSPGSVEQIELQDAARLTLGYINFELSRFDIIDRHLAKISPAFYDYPAALLLRAWTSYKLSRFEDCLVQLRELTSKYPEHPSIPEAHFLMGQCYLHLDFYPFAVTEFEKLLQMVPEPAEITGLVSQTSNRLVDDENSLAEIRDKDRKLQLQLVATVSSSRMVHENELQTRQAVRDTLMMQL